MVLFPATFKNLIAKEEGNFVFQVCCGISGLSGKSCHLKFSFEHHHLSQESGRI